MMGNMQFTQMKLQYGQNILPKHGIGTPFKHPKHSADANRARIKYFPMFLLGLIITN